MLDALQRYLDDIGSSAPLSAKEESQLAAKIKEGDLRAKTKLIEANLRFVVKVACEYQNRGLQLADLISAGNIGLIVASERFDGTKGFKFISYAVWWIRQSILQTINDQARLIRLPANQIETLKQVYKYIATHQISGDSPAEEQIAEALNLTHEKVIDIISCGQPTFSIDTLRGADGRPLTDILPDEAAVLPDTVVIEETLKEEVERALSTLKEREQTVLRLYFGLGGVQEHTYAAIGEKMGITRERVRQIKNKAIEKMQHPIRSRKLSTYVES